jgi:hypothetical protein
MAPEAPVPAAAAAEPTSSLHASDLFLEFAPQSPLASESLMEGPVPAGSLTAQNLLTDLIKRGKVVELRAYLRANPMHLHTRLYNYGFGLLHEACRCQHLEIVRLLVEEFHADPNLRTEAGSRATPLHQAACRQSVEIVRFLIEHHAKPELKTDGQWLPVHNASHHNQEEVVRLLLEHYSGPDVWRAPGRQCNMALLEKIERERNHLSTVMGDN